MYDALARSLVEPVPERVAEEVRRARERHPRFSRSELADAVVRRAALRSGAVAALAAAPSGWLPLLPVATDFGFQVLSLHRTALAVPEALRRRTSPAERALATVASLAAAGASFWLREKAIRSARRSFRGGPPPAARSIVHAVIGGALSAGAVLAVGKAARDYCRRVPPPR
jgi:hypothetical protein